MPYNKKLMSLVYIHIDEMKVDLEKIDVQRQFSA